MYSSSQKPRADSMNAAEDLILESFGCFLKDRAHKVSAPCGYGLAEPFSSNATWLARIDVLAAATESLT